MSRMTPNSSTVLVVILIAATCIASDWRDDAEVIDVSGGEDHTLVLTKNGWPWACGPNGGTGYFGVLGTGSTSSSFTENTLVRVWDGDMNTLSDYLEDINRINAGWTHSLALESYEPSDSNYPGYVWAWGDNGVGQLGDNRDNLYEAEPIQVLRGAQVPVDANDPNLARIVDISAGRSGQHSLAADANGYAYGWGYNEYGQCGNDESENSKLTPVVVV